MRDNQPVTQREFEVPDGTTLMSVTDTAGRIVYANAAFIEVSGFERGELMGQPHNIVRHPDMPSAAFADMWATLAAGESWTALVKNRRRNGDHYWVRANATPVRRDGRVLGYMSVRTKPLRSEVLQAEALYARLRAGQAQGITLHKGLVTPGGLAGWRGLPQRLSAAARIRLACGTAGGITALIATLGLPAGPAALGLAGVALLGAVLASLALEWQLARPLAALRRQALAVAAGQSDASPLPQRVDELGMIGRSVHQAGLNLRSLLDDVSTQISGLRGAGREVANGNRDLSLRTEQTAASLEETAAAMEQLHVAIRQGADAAAEASRLASQASGDADQGGQVVGQVAGTLGDIGSAASRIADIVGVIDGIAFQTNLLALNAAVEAARAGQHGRGFAVVAGEVRQLAGRCAEAARDIRRQIGDSTERMDSGLQLAQDAGRAMDRIVGQAREVDTLVAGISRSASEQSAGVGQVSTAMCQLDEATRSNAALVEQAAAAARQIDDRCGRLVEAVDAFRGASLAA